MALSSSSKLLIIVLEIVVYYPIAISRELPTPIVLIKQEYALTGFLHLLQI